MKRFWCNTWRKRIFFGKNQDELGSTCPSRNISLTEPLCLLSFLKEESVSSKQSYPSCDMLSLLILQHLFSSMSSLAHIYYLREAHLRSFLKTEPGGLLQAPAKPWRRQVCCGCCPFSVSFAESLLVSSCYRHPHWEERVRPSRAPGWLFCQLQEHHNIQAPSPKEVLETESCFGAQKCPLWGVNWESNGTVCFTLPLTCVRGTADRRNSANPRMTGGGEALC